MSLLVGSVVSTSTYCVCALVNLERQWSSDTPNPARLTFRFKPSNWIDLVVNALHLYHFGVLPRVQFGEQIDISVTSSAFFICIYNTHVVVLIECCYILVVIPIAFLRWATSFCSPSLLYSGNVGFEDPLIQHLHELQSYLC